MGLVWILTSFFGERHFIKRDEKTNLLGENKKGEKGGKEVEIVIMMCI